MYFNCILPSSTMLYVQMATFYKDKRKTESK